MSRVIAVLACGVALAACSMSMPSLDFMKGSPATEVLRVESEPPGADARTTQGQSCRTPCELTVPSGGEFQVSFSLNGYQPQSVQVRTEGPPGSAYSDTGSSARLQPNPVYAELQPVKPPPAKKKSPPRAKTAAKKADPAPASAGASGALQSTGSTGSTTGASAYPWPDPR
jgi:PEGA domain